MERKVEQLLLKGFGLLVDLREPFVKEWKQVISSSKYQNISLVDQFDSMIQFAFEQIKAEESPSVDSFILSLLAEWQNRFSTLHDEYESIFLVTAIENMFHKLLASIPSTTFLDHQAIQVFFSRILDHSLLTQDLEDRIEKWMRIVMSTNILPMVWLAIVKTEQIDFKVEKVVCSSPNDVEKHLIEMCLSLKANQIDHLSLAITRLLGDGKVHNKVVQIPCLNDILLICIQDGEFSVTEQQTEFIKGMYLRQLKLHHLESKMEWKDASLLFLQRLIQARSADCAVQAITQGIVDYMPFKRCALFLYNHVENKGVGVSGYNVSNRSIQKIREAIFQLPLINNYLSSLNHSQPIYFSNASDVLPKKYVQEYRLKSIVVLPISVPTESKLLGIVLLDQGEDSQFEVTTQTLTTLIKFGHYAGELLYSIWDEALQQFGSPNCVLTQREKEVLKLIAEGATINESAQQLHLSSYTVRDYVSVIIQKLAAKNRTDAAVKALRMKLIS
ncbi:LuxR C-terminal-related transcriptional regulator [Neobacillus pocheonensis]|uniref:LuxR C-terminal-related transcriptional regulator n=1 Tax=Neobacillus pocheonensis TaxID=363869 RepID=A0ABT0WCA0_9BACI|nr:LuxR C-terminal-related transcriptional regulator [Neobacillus pocheonensis]